MTASTSLRDLLRGIYEERGQLTAALVVEEASSPDHPLHHRFEWDDTEAARRYRLSQAEELIRLVRVESVAQDPRDDATVREWHAVRRDGKYEPIEQIAQDQFSSQVLLRQAQREWRTLFRRYQHLQEFIEMVRGEVADPPDAVAGAG